MWRAIPTTVFAALALMNAAVAQDWPTRPVTMVVPYAAGGPIDTIAPSSTSLPTICLPVVPIMTSLCNEDIPCFFRAYLLGQNLSSRSQTVRLFSMLNGFYHIQVKCLIKLLS